MSKIAEAYINYKSTGEEVGVLESSHFYIDVKSLDAGNMFYWGGALKGINMSP